MSEKKDRTRINTTLTKSYIDAMDYLIDEGLYLGRGEVILDALRLLFGFYGIAPFYPKVAEFDSERVDREKTS